MCYVCYNVVSSYGSVLFFLLVTGMDRGGFCSQLESGMPSKRESTDRVEYVTVFCTHCLSLIPIHTLEK